MYPHERSLVAKLKDKPFEIIGVNSDSDLSKIQQIVKDKKITWRSFWNGPKGTGGPISKRWNVSGWPTIYVIDAKGIIKHKQSGGDPAPLDKAITEALAEMGHKVDLSEDAEQEDEDDASAKDAGDKDEASGKEEKSDNDEKSEKEKG